MHSPKKICFFCSGEIEGNKSLEHIVPESLQKKLGIKEIKVIGNSEATYARVKVPAHKNCNSEFGSRYENMVLNLFEDTDELYKNIKLEEDDMSMISFPETSVTALLTTWLSKVYYGFFYNDYLKTKDEDWRSQCASIIDDKNFELVRQSYEAGHGFQLPSSLYAFKLHKVDTDFCTAIHPRAVLFKINNLALILCVADGLLTKNYLAGESLARLRSKIYLVDTNDAQVPAHRLAFCEILSLMLCIPKAPKFIITNNQIVNMSFSTLAENPNDAYAIDVECLSAARAEVFTSYGFHI